MRHDFTWHARGSCSGNVRPMTADHRPPQHNADERQSLVGFLDYLRESLIRKVDGLSEAQARKPMVPSGTSLWWLLKHAIEVEQYWLQATFAGRDRTPSFTTTLEVAAAPESVADLIAEFQLTVAESNAITAAEPNLEAVSQHVSHTGINVDLRWILVHLIEETGRHVGHADILRELIDGTTGR